MPQYAYKCGDCTHEFELRLFMADYDKPTKEECPNCHKRGHIEQQLGANAFIDSVKLGIKQPDRTFQREILGRMKRQIPGNKIEQSGRFQIPGRI